MAESQDIELILPDEEVDPRAADVIQESGGDFDSSEVADPQNEELEEYSDGVKKRIDKLTYRMREAERQKEEAIEFAKKISEQNNQLQTKLKMFIPNLSLKVMMEIYTLITEVQTS